MDGGIYALVSGAKAQQRLLDVAADNMANLSTPGFKKDVGVFEALFTDRLKAFVDDRGLAETDLSQGVLRKTDNPLDIALDGEGFFVVETDRGIRYTRYGSFTIDREGRLSTPEGFRVLGQSGASIVLSGGKVTVDKEGNIFQDGIRVDRLKIVHFADNRELTKEGVFFSTTLKPLPTPPAVDVRQGYIEEANVNPVREMVALIEAYRRFEGQMKLLQAMNEATGRAIKEL